jgi:broad specificity phosphatase PhoE
MTAEVYLLRHGATEWSAAGRHTGRTDVALTDEGEHQARAAGAALRDLTFGLVLSSPLRRALVTAQLADLPGIEVDPDLQEWDYGAYEGLTTPQIRERRPGWLLWDDGVPLASDGSGEAVGDVGARADRVIARIEPAIEAGERILLVSHGHFLRVLAARWLGLAPVSGRYFALDTATLSVLGFEHGERVIRQWNRPPA